MRTVVVLVLLLITRYVNAQSGELVLQISGFENDEGSCLIYVYDNAEGFPTKEERASHTKVEKITSGRSEIHIAGLQPGIYAVSVVHDENANGKMDSNFLGIPKEGVGTSNNAVSLFGPPKFSDAKFEFKGATIELQIKMKYL